MVGAYRAVLLLVLCWCFSLGSKKSGELPQDEPIEIIGAANLLKQPTISHHYVPIYPGTLDTWNSPRMV